jgi:DNA-binding transcriptional LysR family regulator
MNGMHKRMFDLNLLIVFHALMQHRNVTRAASEIGLTQSAVSHAVGRLRQCYGDPLFVRAKGGVQPTRRALEIAEPISDALQQIAITAHTAFDPATLRRTFRIGLVDYGAAHLLPAVMEAVGSDAPNIKVTTERLEVDAVERLLGGGDVDLAVGVIPQLSDACQRVSLFADRFTVIARDRHPAIGARLSLARYKAAAHVQIPLFRAIDAALADIGIARHFSFVATNVLAVPFVVAQSNLIATLPRSIATVYRDFCRLHCYAPPFDAGRYVIDLAWHQRHSADTAHAWFRGIVEAAGARVQKHLRLMVPGVSLTS